ncbi:MAG: inositol monophosphatase family protein [Opitutales bacterium]
MEEQMYKAVQERLDALETMLPELGRELSDLQKGELEISSKSTDVDLVTQADHVSEARLLGFIRERFPNDGILAEEGGQSACEAERKHAFQWVLDPIDGTANYAHGLPGWAISLGLLYAGEAMGGIVTAPVTGEHFRAVLGKGATCNGRPIRVNDREQLREGLVVTGFPYDRAQRATPLCRALENMLRESGGVRRLGAAALDFCYVACGRFAGYYEMGLKPWDAAAGALIASEAGARITGFRGETFNMFQSSGVVVSNGAAHDALLKAAAPMLEAIALDT